MSIFSINEKNILAEIGRNDFKLERELQSLTENNLNTIFNLDFVSTELKIGNFRLDTLGFDTSNNSFVIIEYKRDKKFSVIDQGFAYLSLMLNNKAEFILEFNERNNKSLKRQDVDWSQSKVLFISQEFTTYQREAVNFKDLPIELWEIKRYKNKTVSYNKITKSGAQESIKTVSKSDKTISRVSNEIKIYSEEDHLNESTDEIRELYESLKLQILNVGDIQIKATKKYIAFVSSRNVVDVRIQKKAIKLWINLKIGELDDHKKLMRDVSNVGHHGNGHYEAHVTEETDFEYLMSLVKQSYVKNSS